MPTFSLLSLLHSHPCSSWSPSLTRRLEFSIKEQLLEVQRHRQWAAQFLEGRAVQILCIWQSRGSKDTHLSFPHLKTDLFLISFHAYKSLCLKEPQKVYQIDSAAATGKSPKAASGNITLPAECRRAQGHSFVQDNPWQIVRTDSTGTGTGPRGSGRFQQPWVLK